MGEGYLFGCLLSLLLWKFDRKRVFEAIDNTLTKIISSYFIRESIYLGIIILLYFPFLYKTQYNEIINLLVAFLIVDISNSERKTLKLKEKIKFYESLALMTKGLLCGFVTPFLLILVFKSNYAGIAYFLIYNINEVSNYKLINIIFKIVTTVPSLMVQILYYLIYIFRNKKFKLSFKGNYLSNLIEDPCLNLNIIGSYIESVNYYYYFKFHDTSYIKSYGNYNNRIDEACVKDYLSISYGTAFLLFGIFIICNYYR